MVGAFSRTRNYRRIAFYALSLYTFWDAVYHHTQSYLHPETNFPNRLSKDCSSSSSSSSSSSHVNDKLSIQILDKTHLQHPLTPPSTTTFLPSWLRHLSSDDSHPQHAYRSDGILEVNPLAPHPIPELMARAERLWNDMHRRQSKTLPEAVREYVRRYGRLPPKGFDDWWNYTQTHSVPLPDEYDLIYSNISPFFGLPASQLRQSQLDLESSKERYTILSQNGTLSAINPSNVPRAQDQINLVKNISHLLPDFRASMSIHDGPSHTISWEYRQALLEAASKGEYISKAPPTRGIGWSSTCPPSSPLRHTSLPTRTEEADFTHLKSFIHSHHVSSSPCLHPSHTVLNGFLASHKEGPGPEPILQPAFAICSTGGGLHSDILTVAPEQFLDLEGDKGVEGDVEWEMKWDERLMWRGSNTGILFQDDMPWNQSQRVRLVELTTRRGANVEVLLPPSSSLSSSNEGVGEGVEMDVGKLNSYLMDIGFSGRPIQCGTKGGVKGKGCEDVEGMFDWKKKMGGAESGRYKFLLDIDGNGWSARFKRLMTTNSVVFKVTIFPEWYSERIMPWLHYVPIQNDLSDLHDALLYFRGTDVFNTGGGLKGDMSSAHKIAMAGKEWSKKYWRREDMAAYMFRLYLEYARVMADDRDEMSLDLQKLGIEL